MVYPYKLIFQVPSRELTYSTFGKGKSSTKKCFGKGCVIFQEGIIIVLSQHLINQPGALASLWAGRVEPSVLRFFGSWNGRGGRFFESLVFFCSLFGMLWIVGVYVRFFEDLTLRTFGLLRFFDVIVFFSAVGGAGSISTFSTRTWWCAGGGHGWRDEKHGGCIWVGWQVDTFIIHCVYYCVIPKWQMWISVRSLFVTDTSIIASQESTDEHSILTVFFFENCWPPAAGAWQKVKQHP